MADPITLPTALRAGTSWLWTLTLPDYAGWSAVCAFRSAAAHFDVVASADGDTFTFAAAPSVNGAYLPGDYTAFLFAEQYDGDTLTDRVELASGSVAILPNVALAAAHDSRSTMRRILDAIDAAILNRATTDQLDLIQIQSGDKNLVKDKSSLLEYRSKIAIEVAREEAGGRGRATNYVARFR